MKSDKSGGNVIDMTSRIQEPNYKDYLKGLKVRFDLENTKVAVSTSLLSIVILVTLANNNLLANRSPAESRVFRAEASLRARALKIPSFSRLSRAVT